MAILNARPNQARRRASRAAAAFASRQSRITVSGDTFNTDAVSSTLNPPKNRSSTTRLLLIECRQRPSAS
jgi:hypothetical protein